MGKRRGSIWLEKAEKREFLVTVHQLSQQKKDVKLNDKGTDDVAGLSGDSNMPLWILRGKGL